MHETTPILEIVCKKTPFFVPRPNLIRLKNNATLNAHKKDLKNNFYI